MPAATHMTTGRLLHYTAVPLEKILSRVQPEHPSMKPNGLWLSVEGEDDWRSWCEAQKFRLYALALAYEVQLHDAAAILTLDTEEKVRSLADRFPRDRDITFAHGLFQIDWPALAQVYQGIIIAPYQWGCRLDVTGRADLLHISALIARGGITRARSGQ
jgi:hypothetical protein